MYQFRRLTVIAGVAYTSMAATHSLAESADQVVACSGFSDTVKSSDARVLWSFRSCRVGSESPDVQLRFHSQTSERLELRYQMLFKPVRDCRADSSAGQTGNTILEANSVTPWPYLRHPVPASESFQGNIWICVTPSAAGAR